MKTTTPMMLPWLARKWGVNGARATELWYVACRQAEAHTGERNTSVYFSKARELLIDLLDQEVLARYPATATPWVMIMLNLTRFTALIRLRLFEVVGRVAAA